MHIKPPSTSPAATTSQPARPASATGKGSDFAQMLKTAQAEAPAAGPTATPAINPAQSQA